MGNVLPFATGGAAATGGFRRAEIGTLEIEDMPSIESPCCDYCEAVTAVAANTSGCAASASASAAAISTIATVAANAVLAAAARTAHEFQSVQKGSACTA